MMTIEGAIALACQFHEGQLDKIGEPYIFHPLRVMLAMNTLEERVVAVLHDIIEDTGMSAGNLHSKGYSNEVVDAVLALTKGKLEDYKAYLVRVSANPIALRVKKADINDNLSPIRICRLPTEKSTHLIDKYTNALNVLYELESK